MEYTDEIMARLRGVNMQSIVQVDRVVNVCKTYVSSGYNKSVGQKDKFPSIYEGRLSDGDYHLIFMFFVVVEAFIN
jgi:hypothetical protein